MNTKNPHDPATMLQTIVERRRKLKEEDAELAIREDTLRSVLAVIPMSNASEPSQIAPALHRSRKRPPRATPGAFEAGVLKALGSTRQKLTNGQIRAAMTAQGYPHALSVAHVSRELAKLADLRKVVRHANGANTTYTLPAKAHAA